MAALGASLYQFKENLRAQEKVIDLQAATLKVERASKAVDLFDRYLSILKETPDVTMSIDKRKQFYLDRNNRAIEVLGSIYSTARGDEDWENIISDALQRYTHVARKKDILCEPLSRDFRNFIARSMPDTTDKSMCSDYYESD